MHPTHMVRIVVECWSSSSLEKNEATVNCSCIDIKTIFKTGKGQWNNNPSKIADLGLSYSYLEPLFWFVTKLPTNKELGGAVR